MESRYAGGRFQLPVHVPAPAESQTCVHVCTVRLRECCCKSLSHSVTETKLRRSPSRAPALCLHSSGCLSLPENGLPRPARAVVPVLQWSHGGWGQANPSFTLPPESLLSLNDFFFFPNSPHQIRRK